MADYRYDEGLRIRNDLISPCLKASLRGNDIANCVLLIQVNEDQRSDEEKIR